MTNANDVRHAHEILDDISIGHQPSEGNLNHLRSFLPELPKQKTVEELTKYVFSAWATSCENEWGGDGYGSEITLEHWLEELHKQLKGLESEDKLIHPEFLETGAEYQEAPWGTIVAKENAPMAWVKTSNTWASTDGERRAESQFLWGVPRRVLRWGEGV